MKMFRFQISQIIDEEVATKAGNLLFEIKETAEKMDGHILSTGPISHSFLIDARHTLTEKRIELTQLIKDAKRSQLI